MSGGLRALDRAVRISGRITNLNKIGGRGLFSLFAIIPRFTPHDIRFTPSPTAILPPQLVPEVPPKLAQAWAMPTKTGIDAVQHPIVP